MPLIFSALLFLALILFLLMIIRGWRRLLSQRLPEEIGQPIMFEARDRLMFNRITLYEDFLVNFDVFSNKPRLIRYNEISRIGVARRKFLMQTDTIICIDYKDDQENNRYTQIRVLYDSKPVLEMLAYRLEPLGKGITATA